MAAQDFVAEGFGLHHFHQSAVRHQFHDKIISRDKIIVESDIFFGRFEHTLGVVQWQRRQVVAMLVVGPYMRIASFSTFRPTTYQRLSNNFTQYGSTEHFHGLFEVYD